MNKTSHSNAIIYDNGKGKTLTIRMHMDNVQITFYYDGDILETFWVNVNQLVKAFRNHEEKDYVTFTHADGYVIMAPMPSEPNAFMRFTDFEFTDLFETICDYYKIPVCDNSMVVDNMRLTVPMTLDNIKQDVKIETLYAPNELNDIDYHKIDYSKINSQLY